MQTKDQHMSAHQTLKLNPRRNAETGFSQVRYRLATSKEELEQAFQLVWRAYVRVGLEKYGRQGVRVTKYHLLPDTKVFVAVSSTSGQRDKIIGTVSIVPDGVLGLPAEEVAREELVRLRREGKRAAECVALACDDEGTQQRVILKLFRLAFEYCRRHHYSTILASLTERHIGFYRRFVGFQPLGELKPYTMGNGTPVQAHLIHVSEASAVIMGRAAAMERDPEWYSFWQNEAGAVLSEAEAARPWDEKLIRYFAKRSSNFAKQLDLRTIQLLNSEYFRYGWRLAYYK
jgi:hypothetical protein